MNQEKQSPFMMKVLDKIASTSKSPAQALSAVFPVRLGVLETAEAKGEFTISFGEGGFQLTSKRLMVDTGTGLPPTDLDGMLAIALFLLDSAEYKLAEYQAKMFCRELDKLIEAGSLSLHPEEDIPDHIFQLVMVNASVAAHDENQVPEGETIQ